MTDYLETLDEEARAEDFPVPPGVVFSPVDWMTGERAIPRCTHHTSVILEAFLDGTEPTAPCSARLPGLEELPWPFQLAFYTPLPGEPMPTGMAVEAADVRLIPTPTPEEQGELPEEEEETELRPPKYPEGAFSVRPTPVRRISR
jgi:hypothetical protein